MIKKIKIIALVLVILISMVGIPSVNHFCEMMGYSLAGDCDNSCSNCNIMQEETDCCSMEENLYDKISITSEKNNCCSNEFSFNKIDDEFIFNKYELNNKNSFQELSIPNSLVRNLYSASQSNIKSTCLSPPNKFTQDIVISTLCLLI